MLFRFRHKRNDKGNAIAKSTKGGEKKKKKGKKKKKKEKKKGESGRAGFTFSTTRCGALRDGKITRTDSTETKRNNRLVHF